MVVQRGSELKRKVSEALNRLDYDSAIDLILQVGLAFQSHPPPFLECEKFIHRSIHLTLESILFHHSIPQILALYIRHSTPPHPTATSDVILTQFHQWLIFSFTLPQSPSQSRSIFKRSQKNNNEQTQLVKSPPSNDENQNSAQPRRSSAVTRSALDVIKQHSQIWDTRLAAAQILLLYRVSQRLGKLEQLATDARSLCLLLAGFHINSNKLRLLQQSTCTSASVSCLSVQSTLLELLIQTLQCPHWQSEHLSSDDFTQVLLKRGEQQSATWKSVADLIRSSLMSEHAEQLHNHQTLLRSQFPSSSLLIHNHQPFTAGVSYFYQVLTPKMIESLEVVWNHLQYKNSNFGIQHLTSLTTLSSTVNAFDSQHKVHCLRAINEALKSSRPKHRHGAVLVRDQSDVVAAGRNEYVSESKESQGVRHAEVECLVQVLDENGQLPMRTEESQRSVAAERGCKKRRLNNDDRNNSAAAAGYCFYIVEVDEYEIGFSDSQACPSCTAALIRTGIQSQYYTTPNGFVHETIKQHNPKLASPTLEVILKARSKN